MLKQFVIAMILLAGTPKYQPVNGLAFTANYNGKTPQGATVVVVEPGDVVTIKVGGVDKHIGHIVQADIKATFRKNRRWPRRDLIRNRPYPGSQQKTYANLFEHFYPVIQIDGRSVPLKQREFVYVARRRTELRLSELYSDPNTVSFPGVPNRIKATSKDGQFKTDALNKEESVKLLSEGFKQHGEIEVSNRTVLPAEIRGISVSLEVKRPRF